MHVVYRVEHLIGIGQKQAGAHRVRNRTQLRKNTHGAGEVHESHSHRSTVNNLKNPN